jgi:hypothetical protein
MGDIFIQKSSATISTFTNELGNGLTLEQFRKNIEDVDLNDAESLKRAVGSCESKCRDMTVDVDVQLKSSGCNSDGTNDCGEFRTIRLEGIKFRS